MSKYTVNERKLIKHAKKAIIEYNQLRRAKGGIDTLYAFVMSNSGKIYDGACFETNISHSNICAERHAIANMILKETYKAKIKIVLVADPVPKLQPFNTPPCGTCRHIITEFGEPGTIVLCMQYIQQKKTWIFLQIDKYKIKELYPHPYVPVRWN